VTGPRYWVMGPYSPPFSWHGLAWCCLCSDALQRCGVSLWD